MLVKMDDVMVRIVIRTHSGAWPAQYGLQLYCGYGHGEGMVVGKQEALPYEMNIQLESCSIQSGAAKVGGPELSDINIESSPMDDTFLFDQSVHIA